MTIRHPFFLVVLVLLLGFQAVTCGEDYGPSIKRPLEGLIKGAPDPPDPPYGGGGPTYFRGGYY